MIEAHLLRRRHAELASIWPAAAASSRSIRLLPSCRHAGGGDDFGNIDAHSATGCRYASPQSRAAI